LVDAEQDVGEDDPTPRGCPDQKERHRQSDQPPGDQHGLASEAVREGAGEEVGAGLDDAEGGDVGERRRERGEAELVSGQQGQDGPLLAEHAADEGIDRDEQ
jgi:hypothetical protein